jgi:hypothetical protein
VKLSDFKTVMALTARRGSGQTLHLAMPKKKRLIRKVRRIPPTERVDVTREEFDRLLAALNDRSDAINELRHDLDIQFKRMAQIQSEVDEIQRAIQRLGDLRKR